MPSTSRWNTDREYIATTMLHVRHTPMDPLKSLPHKSAVVGRSKLLDAYLYIRGRTNGTATNDIGFTPHHSMLTACRVHTQSMFGHGYIITRADGIAWLTRGRTQKYAALPDPDSIACELSLLPSGLTRVAKTQTFRKSFQLWCVWVVR